MRARRSSRFASAARRRIERARHRAAIRNAGCPIVTRDARNAGRSCARGTRAAAKSTGSRRSRARYAVLKPPRYPTLWEACAHAILFQQISIHAAAAIMRRAVEMLGETLTAGAVRCIVFPPPQRWLEASDADAARCRHLAQQDRASAQSAAEAFASGRIDEAQLEGAADAEAARTALRASAASARGAPRSSCCADSGGSTPFRCATRASRGRWHCSPGGRTSIRTSSWTARAGARGCSTITCCSAGCATSRLAGRSRGS